METVIAQMRDISVDQIIERVLIRSNSKPYDYAHKDQLTPQQHLWHFQLQQENMQLKNKLEKLTDMLRRREGQLQKQSQLQKQLKQLRDELEAVLSQNAHLQTGISRLRLKNNHNSHINQSLQDSMEDSLRNRRTNRQCSCASEQQPVHSSPHRKTHKIVRSIDSPNKEILKLAKQISILCKISENSQAESREEKLREKKQQVVFLQELVRSQTRILEDYEGEIGSRSKLEQMGKKQTQPSTERLYPLVRPTSVKTFFTSPAAGSIVKIKRS